MPQAIDEPAAINPQKKSVRRVVSAVLNEPWAITETKLQAISDFLEIRANGGVLTEEEIRASLGPESNQRDEPRIIDGVQVIERRHLKLDIHWIYLLHRGEQ